MLPLSTALCNLSLSLPRTTSFLESFEATENPDYINIIKFGDSLNFDELINVFKRPKIILDTSSLNCNDSKLDALDYLNLPRYGNKISTLKLFFNHAFSTIILIDQISKLPIGFINEFLSFSRLESVLIISANENLKSLDETMRIFYTVRIINVVHLDIATFEDQQLLSSFESFPEFQLVSKPTFEKEAAKNIRRKEVQIGFHIAEPYVMRHRNYKQYPKIAGIHVHFFKSFVNFINGTLVYEVGHYPDGLATSDFRTGVPFLSLSHYKQLYPLSPEIVSNVLDNSNYIIICPKAKPTDKKLYLSRIFEIEVWILTLVFVVFGSGIFAFYQKMTKKKVTFWRVFGQLLRSSLAQAFPFSTTCNLTSVFYFIPIWFGFILTAWFNSILGSFMTTILYEKQARTFEDLRMQNIRVLKEVNDSTPSMIEIPNDLITLVSKKVYQKIAFASGEYAVGVTSQFWDYLMVPFMNYYRNTRFARSEYVLETSFSRIVYVFHCPYKDQLNRFIDLIKDTGLYQHWCDIAYLEAMQLNLNDGLSYEIEESRIQVLRLDFFTYTFSIWAIGLVLSAFVFLFEARRIFYSAAARFRHRR